MINNLTLSFDGKEIKIPIDFTDAQIKSIYDMIRADTKITGWERPEMGNCFFYEDALNRVQCMIVNENSETQKDILYEAANCYSSELVAKTMSRGDALTRKLRRFAAENRSAPVAFYKDGAYTITYNYEDNCLEIGMTGHWMALGDILFETEELAREAIELYHDELIWYFTEMKDRL